MAIDPKAFEPKFEYRLQDLMTHLRKMKPVSDAKHVIFSCSKSVYDIQVDPEKPVLVQGDPERDHMEKVKRDGGLRYVPNQHETMKKLAAELKVGLPSSKALK